jgi:hypothetical protein
MNAVLYQAAQSKSSAGPTTSAREKCLGIIRLANNVAVIAMAQARGNPPNSKNRLLRRFTPRNDILTTCHCERSEAICSSMPGS